MDLNLQAVSATVVLGAYFTLGLGLLLRVFFQLPQWSTLWPSSGATSGSSFQEKLALFFASAGSLAVFFTVGLVMEDLSNKFVDARDTFWSNLNVLPAESQLRMEALFGGYEASEVNPLGDEWARSGLLDRYGGGFGHEVAEAYRARRFEDLKANPSRVRDVASDTYYRAKNTLYREPTHFDELEEIQRRIDFSRSFALLTLFLFLAALLFLALESLWPGPGRVRHRIEVARHLLMGGSWPSRPVRPPMVAQQEWDHRVQAGRRFLAVLPALLLLFVCARVAFAREEREFNVRAYGYFVTSHTDGSASPLAERLPPISGMARTSPHGGHLLVVHDTKNDRPIAPRVGLLEMARAGEHPAYVYRAVDVDWAAAGGPSNDLEAACALPERPGEFLLLESGPDLEDRPGRLFHLKLDERDGRWWGTVERTFSIEPPAGRPPARELEGMGCIADGQSGVRLLLCERRAVEARELPAEADGPPSEPETAGTGARPRMKPPVVADLRTAAISRESGSGGGTLRLSEPLRNQIRTPAAPWDESDDVRACSDLHVALDGTVWVAAAEDPGSDTGPFRSLVFAAGTFSADLDLPSWFSDPRSGVFLEGLKVEAVGPPILDTFDLSVATDDEALGGIWRPVRLRATPPTVAATPPAPPAPNE